MKGHLIDRRLNLDARIPGSSSRVIESSAMRPRMRERSVHDMCFGDAVKQFAGTDCGISPALGNLALIGRSVELGQVADNVCRKRQSLENALSGVSRRDQPVGTLLIEIAQVCQLKPAPRRIEAATDLLQAWDAVPNRIVKRSLTAEKKIVIGLGHPAVCVFGRKQHVKRLVDSDNIGNPRQLVLL